MSDIVQRLRAEKLRGIYSHIDEQRHQAADEIERLRTEAAELRTMLLRYRLEVPLGHQPHMMAHAVDVALGRA